jgi:hypothetical protein
MEKMSVSKEDREIRPKYFYFYSVRIENSHRSSEMVPFKLVSPRRFGRLDIQTLRMKVMAQGVT